jgi:DnaB-like helicase N terminal domain/AAA domain
MKTRDEIYNLDAEQTVLGAVLLSNDAIHRVSGFLKADHFHEPAHQKIYDVFSSMIAAGRVVNRATVLPYLTDVKAPSGTIEGYLGTLFAEATIVSNAEEYGRMIRDLAYRRQVTGIIEATHKSVQRPNALISLETQVDELCEKLAQIPRLSKKNNLDEIPLSANEWIDRDLPSPDFLLGCVMSTTSKIAIIGPTGIGKTNFGMALAANVAAGVDFLHWRARKPARVLYIDGEMSRRQFKARVADTVRRLGCVPSTLHLFNHEDADGFQPINTPAGMEFVKALIESIGDLDLVVFDNIMALLDGDQKDEESWQRVLPLVSWLTKKCIGQVWLHHTGHDTSRGYGTKTREWRMDTVIHLTEQKRPDTDVSFKLEFPKARERTPDTRRDFEEVSVALVNDEWVSSAATATKSRVSPLGSKFLDALRDAFGTGPVQRFESWDAIDVDLWRAECVTRGLLDPEKAVSSRTLFNKHKRELIAAEQIACNGSLVWLR